MGTFDSLYFLNCFPACVEHHPFKGEIQTKSLDCNMDTFYVFDDRVFKRNKDTAELDDLAESRIDAQGNLVQTFYDTSVRWNDRATIHAYASCTTCDPIIFEHNGDLSFDRIDERYCNYSWHFLVDSGKIVRTDSIKRQSRADLRAEMLKNGVAVLADDDRVAKRHLEFIREGRVGLFR